MPIVGPGQLHEDQAIRITFGTSPPATDNDPIVGISDGTNRNQFYTIGHGQISKIASQCYVLTGKQYGHAGGPVSNPPAGEYTLVFNPKHRYGSCSSNTGINRNAKFNSQIDINKGISLEVHKDDDEIEEYFLLYFLIEVL